VQQEVRSAWPSPDLMLPSVSATPTGPPRQQRPRRRYQLSSRRRLHRASDRPELIDGQRAAAALAPKTKRQRNVEQMRMWWDGDTLS
jgi:hypothetical protein